MTINPITTIIEDHDVNLKPDFLHEPDKTEELRLIIQNEISGSQVIRLGKGIYNIHLPVITATGSNVTQYLGINHPHKVHRFEIKHTDSNNTDNTDSLSYSLKYGATIIPGLLFTLINESANTASDTVHGFSDYYRNGTRYQLITNTTNTHKIYVNMIVEVTTEDVYDS